MSFNYHDINVGDIVEVTHRGEVASKSFNTLSFALTSEQQDPGGFATRVAFYAGDRTVKDVVVVGRRKPRVGDKALGAELNDLPAGSVVRLGLHRRLRCRDGWAWAYDGGPRIVVEPLYDDVYTVEFIPEQVA